MKKLFGTVGVMMLLAMSTVPALAQAVRPPATDGVVGKCIVNLDFYKRHTKLCNSLGIYS